MRLYSRFATWARRPNVGVLARPTAPTIDDTLRLADGQYLKSRRMKSLVVLHHTAGGSAKSTFKWWNKGDPRRVGTAYLIERDGTIYQVFDDWFWAWHLGVKDDEIEKRSIGIELCSWGGLTLKSNGILYAWDGKYELGPMREWEHKLHHELTGYRGYEYFERYTEAQIAATLTLVPWLCDRHNIRARLARPFFDAANFATYKSFEGVLHHALLRRDKSDLHPGFPWVRLRDALSTVPSRTT